MIEKLPNQLLVMFCNCLFSVKLCYQMFALFFIYFCFVSENRKSGVRFFTELLSECGR